MRGDVKTLKNMGRVILFILLFLLGAFGSSIGFDAVFEKVSNPVAFDVLANLHSNEIDRISDPVFVFTLASWIVSLAIGFLLTYLLIYGIYIPLQIRHSTRNLRSIHSREEFSSKYDEFNTYLSGHSLVGQAWKKFDETLVKPNQNADGKVIHNTLRPNVFFNAELVRGKSLVLSNCVRQRNQTSPIIIRLRLHSNL